MDSKRITILLGALCCSLLTPSGTGGMAQAAPAPNIETMPKAKKTNRAKARTIKEVAPIEVACPEGTAPRLPYMVWVTYSDGTSDFRQARWTNSPRDMEQTEADATRTPAGTTYTLAGYVIGDDTSDNGFPIKATVNVVKAGYDTPAQTAARHFTLAEVTLNGDNRLTHNRDEALREICSWDVSQQLYNYRDTYGLPTNGYTTADGWDSPDTKLKGHGSGHYMSAIAQAYAVATDPAQKETLRQNITRMVNELRECQEKTFVFSNELGRYREARDLAPEAELRNLKGTWAAFDEYKQHPENYGYGYLNAIPAQHCALIEMYRAYNNSDWVWAPYYSVHKQLAGLIDIATYFDDDAICAKALLIAKDMGLWVWNRLHYRTYVKTDGTQAERRAKPGNRYEMWDMYIAGEVGGISESLARLSEMVADSDEKAKLLEAANYFDAPKFYGPLAVNVDDIRMRHANQHIPMIIGALRSYKSNHDARYYNLSQNFWTLLQGRYVYSTGGVGNGEMFRQPYTQTLSMATNGLQEGESQANPDLNETCCAYNLLKLTRDLNEYDPDDARYMDYYERALYNQIVGSLNPDLYQTCYQYSVGLNGTKPFGNETPQSTCCGGTGSENHTKYQEAAYFASDNTLWVALYMPTTLTWKAKGVTLRQECQWPAQSSRIVIADGSADFALKLRVPYWATEGFTVTVNGTEVARNPQPSSYIELARKHWQKGDVVEIAMPFSKHIYYGADKLSSEVASQDGAPLTTAWVGTLMYGPLAMTGTDVATWSAATLSLDSRLGNVTVSKNSAPATGYMGNLLTLTVDGREFQPDYYRNENTTHYYRIVNSDANAKADRKKAKADLTEMQSLLTLARQRKAEQEKWQASPSSDFAPWAPNGYERMLTEIQKAEAVVAKGRKATAAEAEAATASLNKAINTMRPGNLAEMEDLRTLSGLLRRAGHPDEGSSKELHDAVGFGHMVMRYVTDGSGTLDMIRAAEERLRKATGQD